MISHASLVGRPVEELPTPALVVDPDALDHNLRLLATYFAERTCQLRPHFKSHKCVTLAKLQLGAGSAAGITCAKLSEAEQLAAGGVREVLIANQVVGAGKAQRVAALNREAVVRVAVDAVENVTDLSRAAHEVGVTIGVLMEVDIGMGRCGVPPGRLALALARRIAETPGVRFDGLQGFEGHLVTHPDPEERRSRVEEAMAPLVATRRELEAAGIAVSIVSGGGTGTYDITGNIAGVDEVQAGSYALLDATYRSVRPEFEIARVVLATVISASGTQAVADVGLKGLTTEFGTPMVDGHPEATVRYVSEEHIVIDGLSSHAGDRLRLTPSHGCTTNNLYRRMWVVRDGIIEGAWPLEGSGCLE